MSTTYYILMYLADFKCKLLTTYLCTTLENWYTLIPIHVSQNRKKYKVYEASFFICSYLKKKENTNTVKYVFAKQSIFIAWVRFGWKSSFFAWVKFKIYPDFDCHSSHVRIPLLSSSNSSNSLLVGQWIGRVPQKLSLN